MREGEGTKEGEEKGRGREIWLSVEVELGLKR